MGNEDKATEELSCGLVRSLSTWAVEAHSCLKVSQLGNSDPSSVWKKTNTFYASGFWLPLKNTSFLPILGNM